MQAIVSNFQSLEKAKIEVKGLTLLIGESSQGKSAFFRALQAAMTNRFKPGHVRHGEESASVVIRFPEESQLIFKAVRPWSGSTKMAMIDGNTVIPFEKLARTLPKQVADFLNLGQLEVGNENYSLHFHNQFQPPLMLNFSQKKVLEVLSASQALDDYNLLWSALSNQRMLNRGAFSQLDSILSETKTKLSSVKENLALLEPLVPKYKDTCVKLAVVEEGVAAVKELEQKTKLFDALVEVQKKLAHAVDESQRIYDTLTDVDNMNLSLASLSGCDKKLLLCDKIQSLVLLKTPLLLDEAKSESSVLSKLRALLTVRVFNKVSNKKQLLTANEALASKIQSRVDVDLKENDLAYLRSLVSVINDKQSQVEECQQMVTNRVCPYCGSKIEE